MRHDSENKNPWLLKLFIIAGILIFGFIVFSIVKETYKKREVDAEIEKAKQEAEKIEKNNAELSSKIEYFESKDYKEKEAKDKLNLQNPGENVVIIKPNSTVQAQAPRQENSSNDKKLVVKVSNVQKWWNYFFN